MFFSRRYIYNYILLDPPLMMEHTTYDDELRAYDTATTNWSLASVCAYVMCTLDRLLNHQINKARLGEG